MSDGKTVQIGVAVVQWNNSDDTINLLAGLVKSKVIHSIAVSDNGSEYSEYYKLSSAVKKLVKHEDCRITVIRNEYNSGFAQGISLSIDRLMRRTDTDWLWLLNNDITISDKDISDIVSVISRAQPNIYSTPMTERGDEVFSGCYLFNRWTSKIRPIKTCNELHNIPQHKKYPSGANMLVHRDVIETVGGLNPKTFLYFEELDFVRRAVKNGYRQNHLTVGLVKHVGGASFQNGSFEKKKMYHETWSTLYFYWHHERIIFPLCLMFRTLARIITLLISQRLQLVRPVIRATIDFMKRKNVDVKSPKITEICQY